MNKSLQPTPGPWTIIGTFEGWHCDIEAGSKVIARDVPIEDAPLVAAAPNLLWACHLAMKYFEHPDIAPRKLPLVSVPVNALRAAIAQAEPY